LISTVCLGPAPNPLPLKVDLLNTGADLVAESAEPEPFFGEVGFVEVEALGLRAAADIISNAFRGLVGTVDMRLTRKRDAEGGEDER
jgi:hypothetical protein